MSHDKYVRKLKGGRCFSSDFFFFEAADFFFFNIYFLFLCVRACIRALPFQDCVGISHVAVLLVQKKPQKKTPEMKDVCR